ncbi:hypothetical protein L3Q82_015678, partial [Scortum barcoo]
MKTELESAGSLVSLPSLRTTTPRPRKNWKATKKKVEERGQQKRKRTDSQETGCKCRFCKLELKQGPDSPHIYSGIPGVAGKYIYCPAKSVLLIQRSGDGEGNDVEKSQESAFYEMEKRDGRLKRKNEGEGGVVVF